MNRDFKEWSSTFDAHGLDDKSPRQRQRAIDTVRFVLGITRTHTHSPNNSRLVATPLEKLPAPIATQRASGIRSLSP
jgi:hypothetical protein